MSCFFFSWRTLLSKQQLIPTTQVALRVGYSRERVVRLIQTGRLPGALRGGRWYATDWRAVEQLARDLAKAKPPAT